MQTPADPVSSVQDLHCFSLPLRAKGHERGRGLLDLEEPIRLPLQGPIDGFGIEPGVDAGRGQASVIEDVLDRGQIFPVHGEIARTRSTEIMEPDPIQPKAAPNHAPGFFGTGSRPRVPVLSGEDPLRQARERLERVHHLHGQREQVGMSVLGFRFAPEASVQIHVSPLHPEGFPASAAGQEEEQQIGAGFRGKRGESVQEPLQFFQR